MPGTPVTVDAHRISLRVVRRGAGELVLETSESHDVLAAVALFTLVAVGVALFVRKRYEGHRRVPSTNEPNATEKTVSDRERVQSLIDSNGGRMRQTEIVESVDWSKAKVSRLLADLESDGEITKLRLGRENLICLPGHEPAASRSSDERSK